MSDVHPAPHRARAGLPLLLAANAIAPLFWIGQLLLDYGISAFACYPADAPVRLAQPQALSRLLLAFDATALAASLVGGAIAWWAWRQTRAEKPGGHDFTLHTGEGRSRFMAQWGLYLSAGFFLAILFNTIASLTVPPCPA